MKQILSFVLLFAMLLSISIPLNAFADDFDLWEEEVYDEFDQPQESYDELFVDNDYQGEDLFAEDPFIEEYVEPWEEEQLLLEEEYNEFPEEEVLDIPEEEVTEIVEDEYDTVTEDAADFETSDDTAFDAPSTIIQIQTQPTDFTGEAGQFATFTVVATDVASYRWQYSTDGQSWYGATGTNGSEKTNSMNIEIKSGRYKLQYRCLLKDAAGHELTTNAVRMLEPTTFEIVTQPTDYAGEVGAFATFTVEATGAASYRWQYSTDGQSWYGATGVDGSEKTETLTIEIKAARYKLQYRCLLKNAAGSELTTAAVRMVEPFIEQDNVVYKPLSDSTCLVYSYTGSSAEVVIPESVSGMRVIKIGDEAFMNNTTLQSIDLPDSIEVIGARAFKGCSNLGSMK